MLLLICAAILILIGCDGKRVSSAYLYLNSLTITRVDYYVEAFNIV